MIDPNTPIWQLTSGQFIELLNSQSEMVIEKNFVSTSERKLVYGIGGLAKLLNCSKPTATKCINSGDIDDAVIKRGRKVIIDADKALELLAKSQNKSKK